MPAKNPRINVSLDDALYQSVRLLAQRENLSLSAEVKNLLRDAIETHEDFYLTKIADQREESCNEEAPLTHDDVWA